MTLYIAIFIGFLAVNLYVGLSYGRGVKTIQDYALGGQNFTIYFGDDYRSNLG